MFLSFSRSTSLSFGNTMHRDGVALVLAYVSVPTKLFSRITCPSTSTLPLQGCDHTVMSKICTYKGRYHIDICMTELKRVLIVQTWTYFFMTRHYFYLFCSLLGRPHEQQGYQWWRRQHLTGIWSCYKQYRIENYFTEAIFKLVVFSLMVSSFVTKF